jgi:hypothetical protein
MAQLSRPASNTRSIHTRGRGGRQNTADTSEMSANAPARGENPVSIHSRGCGSGGGAARRPDTAADHPAPSRETTIASRGRKVTQFSQRRSATVPASTQANVDGIPW